MLAFDIPNHAVVTAVPTAELIAKGYTSQARSCGSCKDAAFRNHVLLSMLVWLEPVQLKQEEY